jgi:hypothetical protein
VTSGTLAKAAEAEGKIKAHSLVQVERCMRLDQMLARNSLWAEKPREVQEHLKSLCPAYHALIKVSVAEPGPAAGEPARKKDRRSKQRRRRETDAQEEADKAEEVLLHHAHDELLSLLSSAKTVSASTVRFARKLKTIQGNPGQPILL